MGYVNISVMEVVDSYEFATLANELGEKVEKISGREFDLSRPLVDFDGLFIVIDLTLVNKCSSFFLDWYPELLVLKKMAKVMFRVRWSDRQVYLL